MPCLCSWPSTIRPKSRCVTIWAATALTKRTQVRLWTSRWCLSAYFRTSTSRCISSRKNPISSLTSRWSTSSDFTRRKAKPYSSWKMTSKWSFRRCQIVQKVLFPRTQAVLSLAKPPLPCRNNARSCVRRRKKENVKPTSLQRRTSTFFYLNRGTLKGLQRRISQLLAPVSTTKSGKRQSSRSEGWPLKRSNSCAILRVYTGRHLRLWNRCSPGNSRRARHLRTWCCYWTRTWSSISSCAKQAFLGIDLNYY